MKAAIALLILAIPGTLAASSQFDPTIEPTDGAPDAPDVGGGLEDGGGFFDDGLMVGLALGGTGLVAALGIMYFLGVGGLRHVDQNNVLEHPLRAGIMETVSSQPGVHLRELATQHDTAVTNTQWHLRKLEMAGLVRTQKVSGRRLYYPTAGGVATREEAIQNAATRNPNADSILGYIQDNSGCNQRTLAEGLGMNPGTVRWHLRRLQEAGLVKAVPEGSQTRYFPAGRPPRPESRHARKAAVKDMEN